MTQMKSEKKRRVVINDQVFKDRLKYVADVVRSLMQVHNADKECNEILIKYLLENQTTRMSVEVEGYLNPMLEEEKITPEQAREKQLNSLIVGTPEYKARCDVSEFLPEVEPSQLIVPKLRTDGVKPTSDGIEKRDASRVPAIKIDVKDDVTTEELLQSMHLNLETIEELTKKEKAKRKKQEAAKKKAVAKKKTTKKKTTKKKTTKKKTTKKKAVAKKKAVINKGN